MICLRSSASQRTAAAWWWNTQTFDLMFLYYALEHVAFLSVKVVVFYCSYFLRGECSWVHTVSRGHLKPRRSIPPWQPAIPPSHLPGGFSHNSQPSKQGRIRQLLVLRDGLGSVLLRMCLWVTERSGTCLRCVATTGKVVFVCPFASRIDQLNHWLCQGGKTGCKQRGCRCSLLLLILIQSRSSGVQTDRNED